MHPDTYENWVRVKSALEESGNTENHYYKRACTIVQTKQDPLETYLGGVKKDE